MQITNFGGNVSFSPRHFYTPASEEEVIEILDKHSTGTIRVIASLHAWSEAVVSEDVIIDMRLLNKVALQKDKNGFIAYVQAGCKLKDLVKYINNNSDATIPTLGGLMRQTIAGAISTGTHGSGASSLSHYMEEVRVAAYNAKTKKAEIYTFKEEDALQAVRCAVGCMGVILSVKFRLVPKFFVKETTAHFKTLKEVLGHEKEFPLQQFMMIPYLWEYSVFQRKILPKLPADVSLLKMRLYGFYDHAVVEILPHLLLKFILYLNLAINSKSFIPWFYKNLVPKFLAHSTVVNESADGLTLHTLHHATFQHLEMEVFIPEEHIHKALEMIRYVTNIFAGIWETQKETLEKELEKAKLLERIQNNKNSYIHHYPFFIRKVLPDEALISATTGNKSYYAIGFFTYFKEEHRKKFYEFAYCMAIILTKLFDARLHWGKYFPLQFEDVRHLYPNMNKFHKLCDEFDPKGVFRNKYARRVLGLR